MNTTLKTERTPLRQIVRLFLFVSLLNFALLGAVALCFAQSPAPIPISNPNVQTQVDNRGTKLAQPEPNISSEQLGSLVGPVALYSDPLLIQVLAASTYPLEIIQLKQWLDKNKNLRDKALAEAVTQQNWDPSIQALAAFPAVVDKLADNIQWTTDLGNAFLGQEDDVMDAVQQLRAKAQENGALKTNDKQKVETESTSDGKQAIRIEPAQREVVYVPTYNTQYVYRDSGSSGSSGSSGYSGYSDYSGYSGSGSGYDYSYIAYAVGAAYGSYWGNYNWRDRYADVNYNNYFNRRSNYNSNNKVNNSGNSNWSNKLDNSGINNWSNQLNKLNSSDKGTGRWQHDPSHRGNAPYGNRDLANRFGQANNRLAGGAGNRPSQLARANPGNQLSRGNFSRPPGGGRARPSMGSPNGGVPNRVGNRMPSNWPNGARGGAFGPSNGNLARAFSGRGAQSLGPQSGFRGGPPAGLHAGGLPMGGGFRGGPPGGGFPGGGPPLGGLPAGGPPMGGPPPPPPPPVP